MLALLSLAELLGMSVWFAASATAPHLRAAWGLSVGEAGWLTTSVQLGFVAGTLTAAVLNLADVIPSRRYFAVSALLAGASNAALLAAGGYGFALASRFATGFFLAGVYPPAMKMAATWFRSNRGLAIGTVVGALTIGKAFPYLVDAIGGASVGFVVWSTTACAVLAAALIATGYRDGPYAFERRPFSWGLVGTVLRDREWRLATGGYLGHMWELYAFWTWIAAFLAASGAARAGVEWTGGYPTAVKLIVFATIADRGARLRVGRSGRGPDRAREADDRGSLGLGRLRAALRIPVRFQPAAARAAGAGVGLLRGSRLGPVQRPGDRGLAVARRGHGPDDPGGDGLPAHHGHHTGRAADRRSGRLALGLPDPGGRAGVRNRGHAATDGYSGGDPTRATVRRVTQPGRSGYFLLGGAP